LYIIRHAKSSWDNSDLSDFDRPLNERGKRDAPRMGKRLKERDITIDLMLSSPAKRALSTCKRIAETLGYSKEKIITDKKLYHATEDYILTVLKTIKDHHKTVAVFGHNPGLTEFANALTGTMISNMPTCAVVACKINIDTWKEAEWKKAELLFFDFPKSKDA
jgi:phosphohistidine phosphatase